MKNGPTAVLILAAAQFVMVLDSSVMNVAISQIVAGPAYHHLRGPVRHYRVHPGDGRVSCS